MSSPWQEQIFGQPAQSKRRAILSKRIETGTLREDEPTVWHMWFPEDNVNNHAIRVGNPPADQDRPKYLRRLNLVIDLNDYVGPINVPEESSIITDI